MTTEDDKTSHEDNKIKYKSWKHKIIPAFIGIVGLIMIFGAGAILIDRNQKTKTVNEVEIITEPVTSDTDAPDENKPDVDTVEYEVAADMPRRIIIPEINVNNFIQQVGKTDENAVAVPTNIHIGGWYIEGVLPGQEGLSIIDGHVSGKYSDGIFKNLKNLTSGSTFQIEFGDKSIMSFKVAEVRQVSESESASLLFKKIPSITAQLNLITCGGQFDEASQSFADRVIVVAYKQ